MIGWSFIALLILIAAVLILQRNIPIVIDKALNKVSKHPPYKVGEEAMALHKSLFVVDLHADSLLWKRKLLKRVSYGHVDVPRLLDGNVSLQIFGVPTQIPRGINFDNNPSDTDLLSALILIQAWPIRTWGSTLQRAIYQAEKLEKFAELSNNQLMVIRNVEDLDKLTARREANARIVGGLLGLEGVHALEGDINNLDVLINAGFRVVGLAHFIDNAAAGSAHGMKKSGLSDFGRELVEEIQRKHLVLDLAHASAQSIDDVLNFTKSPVFVSHTGVRGTCDNQRNLSDKQVLGIAKSGGVIGIAFFETAVCGTTLHDVVRSIRYVSDLAGVDSVAIGSDFDGAIHAPINTSGLPLLTEALMKNGFTGEEISKIMGGNAMRNLRSVLPAS